MRNILAAFLLTLLGAAFPALAGESDLTGVWTLRVQDLQKRLQVVASIRFSDKPAQSCMAGAWKSVVVESISKKAKDFFPISGPLAYSTRDGMLTLGRTEVCDDYLFLTGPLTPDGISGDYSAVSLGDGRPLGTFTLRRSR